VILRITRITNTNAIEWDRDAAHLAEENFETSENRFENSVDPPYLPLQINQSKYIIIIIIIIIIIATTIPIPTTSTFDFQLISTHEGQHRAACSDLRSLIYLSKFAKNINATGRGIY